MSAQAIAVQGTLIQVGNGSSPETFTTIANVSKFTFPLKAKVVDVSNIANTWMQQIPTLLSIGDIQLDIFWVMEDPTLRNSATTGLRYMFVNKILKDFQFVYNDGNSSTDAFTAYVTACQLAGQVGDVFKGTITLAGTGTPSLV